MFPAMSETPPNVLTSFLGHLREAEPALADRYFADIHACFATEEGTRVMELLEKAVLLTPEPPGCSDRALREKNGQRLLIAEIRRIVKHSKK